MSEVGYSTTENVSEAGAVSEPMPQKANLAFDPYEIRVAADANYRCECWLVGDNQPLWTKQGLQTVDEAMLEGLMWLKNRQLESLVAVQNEIDKRMP